MANAKKCDRCGAFYVVTGKKTIYVAKKEWSEWNELDLCSECQNKLKEFLDFNDLNKEVDE